MQSGYKILHRVSHVFTSDCLFQLSRSSCIQFVYGTPKNDTPSVGGRHRCLSPLNEFF